MGIMIWLGWGVATFLGFLGTIWVSRRLSATQPIYEDSPDRHQAKTGTATMGGIVLFLSVLGGIFLAKALTIPVAWVMATTAVFWIIGMLDDGLALTKKTNRGVSARTKFLLQIAVSIVAIWLLGKWVMPLKPWEYPLMVFLLTGTSNATNLTDGLDGLLGGTMLVSLIGILMVFQYQWLYEEQSMVVIMMAAIGLFLIVNWHPARLFMGDSGSLMLGAFLASCAIISGYWVIIIPVGFVYIIETLSVMIQVIWFKRTGRRVFLMAPLHHHFELRGWSEQQIVGVFMAIQAMAVWLFRYG